jgi:hypothetical protein
MDLIHFIVYLLLAALAGGAFGALVCMEFRTPSVSQQNAQRRARLEEFMLLQAVAATRRTIPIPPGNYLVSHDLQIIATDFRHAVRHLLNCTGPDVALLIDSNYQLVCYKTGGAVFTVPDVLAGDWMSAAVPDVPTWSPNVPGD